jgi:hypothetical protein
LGKENVVLVRGLIREYETLREEIKRDVENLKAMASQLAKEQSVPSFFHCASLWSHIGWW